MVVITIKRGPKSDKDDGPKYTPIYSYTNVSRRDIIKFIIDKSKSLGKFVNNVLLTDRVKCVDVFDRPRYKLGV